jgi:hypothetical protein
LLIKINKYNFDNAYGHSDFSTGGENVCRSTTAIYQSLTRRNMKGNGRGIYQWEQSVGWECEGWGTDI